MDWILILLSRCSAFFRRRRLDADLDEELCSHMELAIEEYQAQGMSEQEARIAAVQAFGGVTQIRETYRIQRGLPWVDEAIRDIHLAARRLFRSPGFALTAILTVAIGIGANVVVFAMLNGILLRSLPVSQPERIFQIDGKQYGIDQSYPDYLDYVRRSRSFTGMLAYRVIQTGIAVDKSVQESRGAASSGNYFDVLGVKPVVGRFFHSSDEHGLGSAPYIVLSYDFWQRRLAGSPNVVGKVIALNRQPMTVLGVAPRDFHGTDLFFWPDYWIPAVNSQQVTGWDDFDWRRHREFTVLGRLKPGFTPQQASQEMYAIGKQMAAQYPDDQRLELRVRKPGPSGREDDPTRKVLLGMTLLALLILFAGCANLASIFAVRAGERSSELAIRLAIGSSRWAVSRQLLTEAILISLTGGVLGTFVARALLLALMDWRPGNFPVRLPIGADGHVYIVAIALSVVSGVLFALLPARYVRKLDILKAIRSNQLTFGSKHRLTMSDGLLLVQVAVCTVLVTSSLVAIQGMMQQLHTPLGFSAAGVTLAQVDLRMAGIPDAQSRLVQKRLLDTASALPGVMSAATSDYAPFLGIWGWDVYSWETTSFALKNVAFDALTYSVSPKYFQTAGTRLLAGRDIDAADQLGSPAVAVVNETFARRLFGTTKVIGKRFKLFDPVRLEIVGVVEDGKYSDLGELPWPAIFVAYSQGLGPFAVSAPVTVLVRSNLPQGDVVAELRRSLTKVVPTAPWSILPWSDAIDRSMVVIRTETTVLVVLGLVAVVLAGTGIFGMASYCVSRRRKDQGIRIALGAGRLQIMFSMLSRAFGILVLGAGVGLCGGFTVVRLLSHMMSFPGTNDPMLLCCTVVVMLVLGLIATWVPARRVLSIDPARLLREP